MTTQFKAVRAALVVVIAMCFAMVTVGGYVRLSGSGFSIPEWPRFTVRTDIAADGTAKDVKSFIPPTTEEGWATLRDTYVKHEPTQEGIAVSTFQKMFWVEWSHRCLASLIGVAYLTFLGLTLYNREARSRIGRLAVAGLFLLLSQALVGGIVILFHVEATKVAIHLLVAYFFISLLVWMLMRLVHPALPDNERSKGNSILKWAVVVYALICVQIFSGGLMAASKAGFQMQTWPRMGDEWIPTNLRIAGDSLVKNFTENIIMIQFWHRWYAMVVALAILFFVFRCMTVRVSRVARIALRFLFAAVVLQITLGVTTLLLHMHPHVALTHQMVGLFVMLISLITVYETANHEVVTEHALAEAQERATAGGKVAARA